MRIPLVPAAATLFGAALIASPLFVTVSLDEAALPEGMDPETALHAASVWIYVGGVLTVGGGLVFLNRRSPRLATFAAGAALAFLIAIVALGATPAVAISLGEMAESAAEDLELVPFFIAIAFYILGVLIAGFGLLRLKRHVDHPSQTTIASGLVALVIAAALIAAPSVINAVGETFGVDGATLSAPTLDP